MREIVFFFRLVPSNNLEIYFAQVAPDAIHSMCLLAHRAQSFNSQNMREEKIFFVGEMTTTKLLLERRDLKRIGKN
jgi:hypothetical protein